MDVQIIVKVGDMDVDSDGNHHWSLDSWQEVGLITTTTDDKSVHLLDEIRKQAVTVYLKAKAHQAAVATEIHKQSDPINL